MGAPVVLTPRDGGTKDNDNDGSFKALLHYSDHGDSGGPVYQYISPAPVDASSYPSLGNTNFVLLGVCHGRTPDGTQSVFTSVEHPVNNAWLHSVPRRTAGLGQHHDVWCFALNRRVDARVARP